MLFRKNSSFVQAVQLDGSEQAYRAILSMNAAAAGRRHDGLEVMTSVGRRILRQGQWLTRDEVTGALKVHDDSSFSASHEAVLLH